MDFTRLNGGNIMKFTLSITSMFLVMLMLPGLLLATAVKVVKWKRPSGVSIVVVSDIHHPSEKEQQQRKDFIEYLKVQENVHLCAEDLCELDITFPADYFSPNVFMPGIVKCARNNDIDAISLEFRSGGDRQNLNLCIDGSLQKYESIENAIPEQFKESFNEIKNKLNKVREEQGRLLMLKEDRFPGLLLQLYQKFTDLECELFDFVLLSHIISDSLQEKSVYVCVGDSHAVFLANAFNKLGYEHVCSFGGYNDKDLIEKLDNYAINFQEVFNKLD